MGLRTVFVSVREMERALFGTRVLADFAGATPGAVAHLPRFLPLFAGLPDGAKLAGAAAGSAGGEGGMVFTFEHPLFGNPDYPLYRGAGGPLRAVDFAYLGDWSRDAQAVAHRRVGSFLGDERESAFEHGRPLDPAEFRRRAGLPDGGES